MYVRKDFITIARLPKTFYSVKQNHLKPRIVSVCISFHLMIQMRLRVHSLMYLFFRMGVIIVVVKIKWRGGGVTYISITLSSTYIIIFYIDICNVLQLNTAGLGKDVFVFQNQRCFCEFDSLIHVILITLSSFHCRFAHALYLLTYTESLQYSFHICSCKSKSTVYFGFLSLRRVVFFKAIQK